MHAFLLGLTYWHWFGFGIVVLIFELVIANTGFLLWIAISAILVGFSLLLFHHLSWSYQLAIFTFSLLIFVSMSRKYFRRNPIKSDKPTLNRRAAQYMGRTLVLEKAIENGRGIVRVDDSIWSVEGPDLPAGTQVCVVGANGVLLKVTPIL